MLDQVLRLEAWFQTLNANHPLLYDFLFGAMVVLLTALVVHIGYTAWLIYRRTTRPQAPAPGATAPDDLPQSAATRAELLAREGRFTEALAWRYLALVRELERRRALEARGSKTPAEYVAEARLDPGGRETLAGLVGILYRHIFGAEPCDAAGYAEFSDAANAVLSHVAAV